VPIGPEEHGPQVGGGIVPSESVESIASTAKLVGQRVERELGTGGGPRRDDDECYRKPRAAANDLVDSLTLRHDAFRAKAAGEQFPALGRGQQVKPDGMSAFRGDQS